MGLIETGKTAYRAYRQLTSPHGNLEALAGERADEANQINSNLNQLKTKGENVSGALNPNVGGY